MLLPFQGAIIRMGFTQGVALGYGLLGFQPVSCPTDGIVRDLCFCAFGLSARFLPNQRQSPPAGFARADYKRAPIKTQGD